MRDFEKRVEKLEKQAEVKAKNPPVMWIFHCSSDEAGPTDEEKEKFQEAYIARYGKPRSPVIVNAFNGRMSADSVEVQYESRKFLGDSAKPFREVVHN